MTREGKRDWLSYFKTEDGNIFFGWYTVLVSSLTGVWQAGTWYYGFGAYFKPLSEEFGWTRATTSALWSLGRFEGGLEGPFGGIATDRWGPRAIHFIGVILSGLGFVLMYFTRDFATCMIFWVIASIGFNLGYAGPLDKAVTEWFVKKRGMAITIGRLGRVVGGTIMPPIMTFLLLGYGWRFSFVILGVVTWIIGIPTAWYLIKPRRPEYYGMLPDGEPATTTDTEELIKIGEEYSASLGEYEFTTKQAFKTSALWIPEIADFFAAGIYPAVAVHLIPFLTDRGVDPVLAAAATGFMVFMSTPGRIIGGVVADRLSTKNIKYLMMGSNLCYAIGMLLMVTLVTRSQNMLSIYVTIAFFGLGIGIRTTAKPAMVSRFFGRKNYGTITGVQALIILPSQIGAPIFAGWIYDVTGSYTQAFTTTLGLAIIGVVLYIFAHPPKPPVNIEG
jgi:sugar phosphate permease